MKNDLVISAVKLINKLVSEERYELAEAVAETTHNLVDLQESAKKLEDRVLYDEYGYMAQNYD